MITILLKLILIIVSLLEILMGGGGYSLYIMVVTIRN